MSDPFDMRARIPKAGSAAVGERDELSGFDMQFDRNRNASGFNLRGPQPEAAQGEIPGPGNYTTSRQDRDKNEPARPGAYNHGWGRSSSEGAS